MGHHDINWKAGPALALFFKVIIIGLTLSVSVTRTANAAELHVPIDESKVFVLDQAIATIAVTNPAIADVSVHNEKMILVVGRTFGTTNIIALNADGKPIATKRVRVVSVTGPGNVTYVRGPGIFSYSCSPRCERTPLPGDRLSLPNPDIGPATFSDTDSEQGSRANQIKSASK